jgi:cell division protease FtsH
LGMVMSLPEIDRLNMFKDECHQRLAMTMAGKAAEIHKYGPDSVSNGPAGDIQQASALARAMVLQWGMSDKVGNIDYSEAAQGYTGNTGGFSVSANTKEMVEQEVQKFIQDGYDWALKIVTENEQEFERLAQGLLEYETLTGEEIARVMRGEPPHAPDDEDGGSKVEEKKPSLTAIPKAKKKSGPSGDGGMEPEPSA